MMPYAAQLRNFKRIGLAAALESLYVLTYTPGRSDNDLPAFVRLSDTLPTTVSG